eukprot:3933544-Rhodomonas_salina.1
MSTVKMKSVRMSHIAIQYFVPCWYPDAAYVSTGDRVAHPYPASNSVRTSPWLLKIHSDTPPAASSRKPGSSI